MWPRSEPWQGLSWAMTNFHSICLNVECGVTLNSSLAILLVTIYGHSITFVLKTLGFLAFEEQT